VLANWITLSRLPLLLINVLALFLGSPPVRLAAVVLLFLGLMLDTVDGMVARKTGQTTLFGSVLDIAVDRTYELVLWVCFADLRMIPAAIPLIVIARTTLTDAFRSIGVAQGMAPFAQHRTALGRFLVGSTWMRVGYSVSKITTFCGLALVQALSGFPEGTLRIGAMASIPAALRAVAWVAVVLCVLRGLPVIVHSLRQHWPTAPIARALNGERPELRQQRAPVRQRPVAAGGAE
jgi:phosphatidylglycerophosphate synthase